MTLSQHHILLLLGLALFHTTHSRPDGAPSEACGFMSPNHGVDAQHIQSPFVITPSHSSYRCRQTVKVNITSTDGSTLKGFLCQARTNINDYSTVVGTLSPDTESGIVMKQPCGEGRGLTHSERNEKSEIKLTWTISQQSGAVTFVCTIVKEKTTFWVKQTSAAIAYEAGGDCGGAGKPELSVLMIVIMLIATTSYYR